MAVPPGVVTRTGPVVVPAGTVVVICVSDTTVWAAGTPLTLIDQPFAALDTPSMRFLTELLQEASEHPSRAWVLADYEAPVALDLASVITL